GAVLEAHRRGASARLGGGAGRWEQRGRPGRVTQPSLWRVLEPKWRTALQRIREERSRGGSAKLLILTFVGLAFWVGVFAIIYLAKLGETMLHSSWMVALMAVPIFAAYGVSYRGGLLFVPYAVLTVLPLLVLPAVAGSALTLVLVNIFPARRTRDLLSIVALGAAGGLILLFRLIRPERLASPEGFRNL